jgi:hypothetical protein
LIFGVWIYFSITSSEDVNHSVNDHSEYYLFKQAKFELLFLQLVNAFPILILLSQSFGATMCLVVTLVTLMSMGKDRRQLIPIAFVIAA